MTKTIRRVAAVPKLPKATRAAAYARVSSGKDAMLHSLSAQVSYYSAMIQEHPGWQYCGVYSDEAFTGTKKDRPGFQRLLADCRVGKIDLIITKSVSRFSRNTLTFLETVRELQLLGEDVFFEEQNIHTMSGEGELMLTLIASFAQEESLSASENQKWRIKRNFEEGKPWSPILYGYRLVDGRYEIVPEEAEIVRRVYAEYLSGSGPELIAKHLNEEGILTRRGNAWLPVVIHQMLRNYNYTGNLLLQKTYRENHLTKRKRFNDGVLPKYLAEGSHEAIIDLSVYETVQREAKRRAAPYADAKPAADRYPFTGRIVCAHCGKHYKRKTRASGIFWICQTYNTAGKAACPSKQIPEERLYEMTADINLGSIERMIAEDGNVLRIEFTDGTQTVRHWEDRSRADSWTAEMRQAAGEKTAERKRKNG